MVFYEKIGQGEPVFLLHGFPNDHAAWNPVIPRLKEKYTLFLPDFPGAGKSDFLSESMSMDDMSNSVHDIFLKENIEKAVITGHSMGGYAAMNFAHHFPEKVTALSLVHSSAFADDEEKKTNRRKAMGLIRKGDLEKQAFLRGMAQNLFSRTFLKEHLEVVQTLADKGNELQGKSLIAFYHAIMNREDRTDVLRNAQFPVQWIIGNEDTAFPMEDILQQAHLAAISDISIYEPCGHMSMLEHPARLIKDLMKFFEFAWNEKN